VNFRLKMLASLRIRSIRIRKEANCINRDAGAYNLPTTYDRILVTRALSTSRDHMPDEVHAVGERNVAIRYIYFALGCVI